MALIRRLEKTSMARNGVHEEVECTYTVFTGEDGHSYLQIDTYGSSRRQFRGKKSQTVQFGPEALAQLRVLLGDGH
ncbi:MAG: methionyl-tRNA formyltransferase [Geminicoccaceae bacterium]